MPYRLGAVPDKHGAADCLSLATAVQAWYGIEMPAPQRSWYRRLRRKDYSVFPEQLERWGRKSGDARVGTLGLIHCLDGSYGLASFYEGGWLQFRDRQATWIPCSVLIPAALYCR